MSNKLCLFRKLIPLVGLRECHGVVMFSMFAKKKNSSVTFATTCWERDYTILLEKGYLQEQIAKHCYTFSKKVLIINNVKNIEKAIALAEDRVKDGSISHFYVASKHEEEVLSFFQLRREDFTLGKDRDKYSGLTDDWVYFNALGPMTALYFLSTDYILYQTGDVSLARPCDWIDEAILFLEKHHNAKIANLIWNHQIHEVKRESYKKKGSFFLAKEGFSDQMFLAKKEDIRAPILSEIREDAAHFPRGDVFEKRIFSYMKNRGWQRITYKRGSYIHPCH